MDLLTKGHTMMTLVPESLPITTPANHVHGPEQGHWTYDDYASIPDDGKRYEVMNGVLFMSPAPDKWHQKAVLRIAKYLSAHIEDTGLGEVYIEVLIIEAGTYSSHGVFEGALAISSRMLPDFSVPVEHFFQK